MTRPFASACRALLCALLTMVAMGGAGASAAPAASVPPGFVGVDVGGPMVAPSSSVNVAQQFDLMVGSGVESVRVVFSWAQAQPYASWSDVPAGQVGQFVDAGGLPTSFVITDQIVLMAAKRGLRVLPTVIYTPSWDARARASWLAVPRSPEPYAAYLTALIGRYGPSGSFWAEHRDLTRQPIRAWQIWNEPNLTHYWPQPFVRTYVDLLRASHTAIKRADPHAQVVLGALTNRSWTYIGQIARVPGARGLFDVVSVNGFTSTPRRVILILTLVRQALNDVGERRTPLMATEVSFPSARGKSPQHFDWNTTEAGQARDVARLLPLLAAQRTRLNLIGFDYYTWMGDEYPGAPAFNFAGLLRWQSDGTVSAKPALSAFTRAALALEGCRRIGPWAGTCAAAVDPAGQTLPGACTAHSARRPRCGRPAQARDERGDVRARAAARRVDSEPVLAIGRVALRRDPGVEDRRRDAA